MRLFLLASLLLPVAGCGKKSSSVPEPVVAPTSSVKAPPPVPMSEPEPEPEPEPEVAANNVSFSVEIIKMDGTTVSGRAVRLERGVDWYAEEGWTAAAGDLKLSLETDRDMKDVAWTDVAQIDITYGSRSDIDCMYDSNFNPWMYMCTLRSSPTAKLKDGSTWRITSRQQWRVTFDDDRAESFYLFRLPARQQDEVAPDLDTQENYGLYGSLQAAVLASAKAEAIKRIVIKP